MRADRRWVFGVAAAPVVFAVMVAVVLGMLGGFPNGSLADAVTVNWMLAFMFGAVVYVPGTFLLLVGSNIVSTHPRVGPATATVGLVAMSTFWLLILIGGVLESLDGPPPPYSGSWAPYLPLGGAIVFSVPFLLLAAANTYVVWRLWALRRRDLLTT
ncbi:hypothetical protein [Prescottella agglutinans]|uniref:Uncharacterized protein n=1 Tax=Prescottella agglutinans TaxID=1644129 RepID=A0ABT6MKB6_9NOCA|nr:hypothetical protein [Prescottella agglutinans]MDH6284324.1 hypothetical protein [Prescottella agglutinans]